MKSDELLASLSDRELVDRLINNDSVVWNVVIVEMILPLAKTRKFVEILTKVNQPIESLPGVVYLDLQKNDFLKLKNFRFDGPFRAWLYFQVRNAVKTIVRESRSPFSNSLSDDELDRALDGWCTHDHPAGLLDEMNMGEACFAQLWRNNPKYAYVLLLKNKLELSSEDVSVLLDLSSANNVDQINRRAKQQMRQFKKEGFE
jgi:hypothetical protein